MPYGKRKKYKRIRALDVGRKGHHYIRLGIRYKKGKKGGYTERIGKIKKYLWFLIFI